MAFLVNIDNGGSFTDAIASDGERVLHVKSPTTPHDLSQCFIAVLERLALECYGETDLARLLGETEYLRYSTTSGTNAVVEHKGTPVGVMVLAGEEHRLYGAESLGNTGLWAAMVPSPVVGLRFEGGAVDATGLMASVSQLISQGVSRIVVALPEPAQELLVKDEVLERYPRHLLGAIPVLFSHELVRDDDHGRRLFSAVVNSYLHPGMELFLYGAERVTRQHHLGSPLLIYRNDGDSARVAKTTAIKTYGSGPRGGLAGAAAYARWYRSPLLVAVDIGGTTTDISTLVDGAATEFAHGLVGDEEIPASFPMGDIVSIGYGGSSIFRLDGDAIRIGPESVGAAPGPACFGRGGSVPTITDALLLAGVLDPDNYLGGELKLDPGLAEKVIGENIAEPLGLALGAAAQRMIAAYESQVATHLRDILASRGIAPGGDLLAFGGGGPMNACGIAAAAGFRRVIVPAYASVFSAYGIGFSDLSHQYRVPVAEVTARGAEVVLAELRERARRDMFGEGLAAGAWAEVVEVCGAVNGRLTAQPWQGAAPAGLDDAGLRLVATHGLRQPQLPATTEVPARAAVAAGSALVYLDGEPTELPVYALKGMPPGSAGAGPALFRDAYLTCLVRPGWSFRVSANGDLILEAQAHV